MKVFQISCHLTIHVYTFLGPFLVSLPFVVLDIKTKYNIFTCPRTSGGDVIQSFAVCRLPFTGEN